MTTFLVIKNFVSLTKAYKKGPTTKQNPNKRKQKKTLNPSSLGGGRGGGLFIVSQLKLGKQKIWHIPK
jgi:hypothetical protein